MREVAILTEIQNNRAVSKETDSEFMFAYQKNILLGLKEQGILTETQYRYAEDTLRMQFHTFAKKKEGK